MDYSDSGMVVIAYLGSNIVGLMFLFVAYRWSQIARGMFALMFGYAAWINYNLSHTEPDAYLDYAEYALGFYADFIGGWFSQNITFFVTLIAAGQLLIAVGMVLRKTFVTLACIGVIIFLTAIAPLGFYAAFPFSITVSFAAFLIIKKDDKQFVWRLKKNLKSAQESLLTERTGSSLLGPWAG